MLEVAITKNDHFKEEFVAKLIEQAILKSEWITKFHNEGNEFFLYNDILEILNGNKVDLKIQHDLFNENGKKTTTNPLWCIIDRDSIIKGMSGFFSKEQQLLEKLNNGYVLTNEEEVKCGEEILRHAYFNNFNF